MTKPMVLKTLRLPVEVANRLDLAAKESEKSQNQILVTILDKYLPEVQQQKGGAENAKT